MMRADSEILYTKRLKQAMDFGGLRYHRNIRPSDIDGVLDFGGNLFIFIEAKVIGTPESVGQNRLLENLADTIQLAGKECVVLWFNHNTPTDEVVDVQNGSCYKRYYKSQYKHLDFTTVGNIIDRILKHFKAKNLPI